MAINYYADVPYPFCNFLGVVRFSVVLSAIFLFGCDKSSSNHTNQIDPSKPAKVQLMQNGKVKPMVLKPVSGVVQHTDFIGTSDTPTLDGGIINAADGLEVNIMHADLPYTKRMQNMHAKSDGQNLGNDGSEIISENHQEKRSIKNMDENQSQKSPIKSHGFSQDGWATSSRVKALLQEAAEDGKLDYVLKKTDQKGMPASVATVPMIESRYKEQAISPKGAAGAWQLMPATAKDYGVNKADRYKFQPATEAALNLLNDLHKQFGNWELAFAAYNAGAERVQTALQKNPKAQSVQELDLPKETKDYVQRIIALNKTMASL